MPSVVFCGSKCPDGVTNVHSRTNMPKSDSQIWYMFSSAVHDTPWTLDWMDLQSMGDAYHIGSMADERETQNVLELFQQCESIFWLLKFEMRRKNARDIIQPLISLKLP